MIMTESRKEMKNIHSVTTEAHSREALKDKAWGKKEKRKAIYSGLDFSWPALKPNVLLHDKVRNRTILN